MDEIIIDDKKYVSSKRAAKITGYAKDYIGQLCREGRVSARLVGRSWYVLESAIRDHRFGSKQSEAEVAQQKTTLNEPPLMSTWESPRYEATTEDMLPSINRLRKAEITVPEREISTANIELNKINEEAFEISAPQVVNKKEKIQDTPYILEDGEVEIPIHSVYDLPPSGLLPRKSSETIKPLNITSVGSYTENGSTTAHTKLITVSVVSFVVCIISVTLALLNSGYLDRYLISSTELQSISGINVYIK